MRRVAIAIATTLMLGMALGTAVTVGSERAYITNERVIDNGAFLRWDFAVCTPRSSHLQFEIEWTQNQRHRVVDGFRSADQPRACGRYTLGLRKRRYFLLGSRVRSRINIYLGGADVIHSRWLFVTPQ